jgi:hypothetical protein
MGGGLMQLVAYGAQDVYLTGNPQITFFKIVYRRHTNFSMECIEQTLNGTLSQNSDRLVSKISRNGDLIGNMHLDLKLPNNNENNVKELHWTNNTAHAYIDNISISIGGQLIDKHYGHWLDIWNELTDNEDNEKLLLNKQLDKKAYYEKTDSLVPLQLYIPLKFWFNRNIGLALPLIALQYHEVEIKLETRELITLVNCKNHTLNPITNVGIPSLKLFADYIYLDTDERRRFAQISHEYLIEQLQYSREIASTSTKLNLNHPVKEIIWTIQNINVIDSKTTNAANDASLNNQTNLANGNDYFCYTSLNDPEDADMVEYLNYEKSFEPFDKFNIKLNGHDRFSKQKASYFRLLQPFQCGHKVPTKHIYLYSFALKPEEHQPSGTCNFSRIDNAELSFTKVRPNSNINIYAINYNVLRIMSGMAGLAYSN